MEDKIEYVSATKRMRLYRCECVEIVGTKCTL